MSRSKKGEDTETAPGRERGRQWKASAMWGFRAGPAAGQGHQRKAGELQMLADGQEHVAMPISWSWFCHHPRFYEYDIRRGWGKVCEFYLFWGG